MTGRIEYAKDREHFEQLVRKYIRNAQADGVSFEEFVFRQYISGAEHHAELPALEFALGVAVRLWIERSTRAWRGCVACSGTGELDEWTTCFDCKGSGEVVDE